MTVNGGEQREEDAVCHVIDRAHIQILVVWSAFATRAPGSFQTETIDNSGASDLGNQKNREEI